MKSVVGEALALGLKKKAGRQERWVCPPSPLGTSRADYTQAWALVDSLEASVVALNPGRGHAAILRHLVLTTGTGGNLTTDAHLAALALENDALLVTGDRDFGRFPGLRVFFPY